MFSCKDESQSFTGNYKIVVTNHDETQLVEATPSTGFAQNDSITIKSPAPDTKVKIFSNNFLVQTIKFHASCSTVMTIGETFGSLKLTAFE
jgi:hypothetical protein